MSLSLMTLSQSGTIWGFPMCRALLAVDDWPLLHRIGSNRISNPNHRNCAIVIFNGIIFNRLVDRGPSDELRSMAPQYCYWGFEFVEKKSEEVL